MLGEDIASFEEAERARDCYGKDYVVVATESSLTKLNDAPLTVVDGASHDRRPAVQ
jgi:hypothetical protein